MGFTVQEVLQFVRENDVKFVRLAFCDLKGNQKNISIMAQELNRAFEQGISIDGSAIPGFCRAEKSDLLLFPDPSTLTVIPWRPQHGRVVRMFCNISWGDRTPFEADSRAVLKRVTEELASEGLRCNIGSECEFYLFKLDEEGNVTDCPLDQGGYLDMAPLDKGENIRRDICINLEEMGIAPESSHHEQGPGQNEVDFRFSEPLKAADNLVTFKSVVAASAMRSGLAASFDPKPIADKSGNGLHINVSLYQSELNLMAGGKLHRSVQAFLAGVLKHSPEMMIYTNPLKSSYDRLGRMEAPKYIGWANENRSQLIRIPSAEGDYRRFEFRLPDSSCNPYLCIALILAAGLDGIRSGASLEPAADENAYDGKETPQLRRKLLPESLEEAVGIASKSRFLHSVLGKLNDRYLKTIEL